MKKYLDLPVPILSKLKKVHIDFSMTGKHYLDLATFDGSCPEEIILSILSDLVEENVDELTKQECVYLFSLVKISNLGRNFPIKITCPKCNHKFDDVLNLADVDVFRPSSDWKIRTIKMKINNVESEYSVLPPPLSLEVKLLDWLSVYKDLSRKDIYEDKNKTIKYTMYMNLLHLVDSAGNRIISNVEDFEKLDSYLEENDYIKICRLYSLVNEVEGFGIAPNVKRTVCKECGENLAFHYPILYGLCSPSKTQS